MSDPMTRDEFVELRGTAVEVAEDMRRYASRGDEFLVLPCDCGHDICTGWIFSTPHPGTPADVLEDARAFAAALLEANPERTTP